MVAPSPCSVPGIDRCAYSGGVSFFTDESLFTIPALLRFARKHELGEAVNVALLASENIMKTSASWSNRQRLNSFFFKTKRQVYLRFSYIYPGDSVDLALYHYWTVFQLPAGYIHPTASERGGRSLRRDFLNELYTELQLGTHLLQRKPFMITQEYETQMRSVYFL